MVTGQTATPKTGVKDKWYRESQLTRAETPKLLWEPVPGVRDLNCNWWIAGGSVWTNLKDKNSTGGLVMRMQRSAGIADTTVSFTSRSLARSLKRVSGKKKKKNPHVLQAGGGEKEPFWNTPEHSVFLKNVFPQEKLFYSLLEPKLLGLYQSLT